MGKNYMGNNSMLEFINWKTPYGTQAKCSHCTADVPF